MLNFQKKVSIQFYSRTLMILMSYHPNFLELQIFTRSEISILNRLTCKQPSYRFRLSHINFQLSAKIKRKSLLLNLFYRADYCKSTYPGNTCTHNKAMSQPHEYKINLSDCLQILHTSPIRCLVVPFGVA